MTDGSQGTPFSLRGRSAQWSGFQDATTMAPGTSLFATVENLIPNRDGTELRRLPGSRKSGVAACAKRYSSTEYSTAVAGSDLDVTIVKAMSGNQHHILSSPGTARVYVVETDGTYTGYTATRQSSSTFRIPGITSVPAGSSIYVQNAHKVHALSSANQRPVVLYETASEFSNGTRYNVSAMTGSSPLSLGSPAGPGVEGNDDTGWINWPSPTLEPIHADDNDLHTDFGWSYNIVGRMQAKPAKGRVIVAVPGIGLLWQVSLLHANPFFKQTPPGYTSTPNFRWMRALGIPKGVLAPFTTAQLGYGVAGWGMTYNQTYKVAIGYYDPVTLEVGLPSEVDSFTTNDSSNTGNLYSVVINALSSRMCLWESVGLGLVVYISEAGESWNTELFPVLLLPPTNTAGEVPSHASGGANYREPRLVSDPSRGDAQVLPFRYPSLEQYAQGGSWVAVSRGRVFSGGQRPDYFVHRAQVATNDSITYNDGDTHYLAFGEETQVGSVAAMDHGLGLHSAAAYNRLPNSFAGARASIDDTGPGLLSGSILERENGARLTHTTHGTRLVRCIHTTDFNPIDVSVSLPAYGNMDNSVQEDVRIYTDPNLTAFSEEDAYPISPAINRLPHDPETGIRVTAGASARDGLLTFTDRQTIYYAWSGSPRTNSRMVLSNEYGCIAPNSVVEYPGGVAWMSDEGPCVFDGAGVMPVGDGIREWWRAYGRDSERMANYIMGTVDLERQLVIWALSTDTIGSGIADDVKAKKPSDRMLMWHYPTGGFFTATRDGDQQIDGISYLHHADVTSRVAMVGIPGSSTESLDYPIYSWVEDAADRASATATTTITAERSGSGTTINLGGADATIGTSDSAYIVSPDGELRWWGQVDPHASGASITDTGAGAIWYAGDTFVNRCIHAKIVTHRMHVGANRQWTGREISVRADLNGSQHWIRATATNEKGESFTLSGGLWGQPLSDGFTRVRCGAAIGEELSLTLEFIGDGGFSLKDITVGAVQAQ